MEEDFGVDGEAAEFDDVFRDGGGEDGVLGGGLGGYRVVLVEGLEGVGRIALRFCGPGLDEMSHHVDPFLVPGKDAAPHLVGLEGFDFPPEAAVRASQNHH